MHSKEKYVPTATTANTSAATGYAYQPLNSCGEVGLVSSPSYLTLVVVVDEVSVASSSSW